VSLPQHDLAHLGQRGQPYDITTEANMVCVVLRGYALPRGYDRPNSDLLLRLQPGYPDVPPDMWWFDPPVRRTDGKAIPATDSVEHHLGRTWQRWSRHFNGGQWRSGVDTLESFLALVRKELERCATDQVA
jgi:hypothetical protein